MINFPWVTGAEEMLVAKQGEQLQSHTDPQLEAKHREKQKAEVWLRHDPVWQQKSLPYAHGAAETQHKDQLSLSTAN